MRLVSSGMSTINKICKNWVWFVVLIPGKIYIWFEMNYQIKKVIDWKFIINKNNEKSNRKVFKILYKTNL